MFSSPYDTQIPALFDGRHALAQIAQDLPSPRALFRPEFLAAVKNATDPFAWQLRANDTVLVTTRAPLRLYYGEADTDVSPNNTSIGALAARSLDSSATIIDLGADTDHPASANLGLRAARAWFDELVSEEDARK